MPLKSAVLSLVLAGILVQAAPARAGTGPGPEICFAAREPADVAICNDAVLGELWEIQLGAYMRIVGPDGKPRTDAHVANEYAMAVRTQCKADRACIDQALRESIVNMARLGQFPVPAMPAARPQAVVTPKPAPAQTETRPVQTAKPVERQEPPAKTGHRVEGLREPVQFMVAATAGVSVSYTYSDTNRPWLLNSRRIANGIKSDDPGASIIAIRRTDTTSFRNTTNDFNSSTYIDEVTASMDLADLSADVGFYDSEPDFKPASGTVGRKLRVICREVGCISISKKGYAENDDGTKRQLKGSDGSQESTASNFVMWMADENTANRVIKAFNDAIVMAGGTKPKY